jgi:hypothetical protein
MSDPLTIAALVENAKLDLVLGAPAAVARTMLGHRADPRLKFLLSLAQKVGVLIGALAFAVMTGQAVRAIPAVQGYVTVAVIAAAFTAQDGAIFLMRKFKRVYRRYENDED